MRNLVFIQSLGGGTGSGLGSFLLRSFKRDFAGLTTANFLVLPLSSGEVTLQFYNTVLSLSEVYQHSDLLFLLRNDDANLVCSSIFKGKAVTFEQMNHVLSLKIAAALVNSGRFATVDTRSLTASLSEKVL